MRLLKSDDFDFGPLAWKEWFVARGKYGSKRSIYKQLESWNEKGYLNGCSGIKNYVRNRRIRRLLYGYAILDLLDWSGTIKYERYKMWRLFEDTVGEILREVIKAKKECTVAYVDRWPGFKGLDYIVVNSKSRLGWKVGVQCKRYVGTRIPYCRVDEYSSYTRGTSASKLYDKGMDLKKRFTNKRKFILVMFDVYKRNPLQQRRFDWLKDAWDSVVVFNRTRPNEDPYIYRLRFDELNKIARWS